MQIVLRQTFPLGRFHATPWAVNPFDDPHGEWPPSPWRLVRAIVARWYQWAREADKQLDETELGKLLGAFCTSSVSFHLPVYSFRGTPMRQYKPVEFGMDPPKYKSFDACFSLPGRGLSEKLKKDLMDIGAENIQIDSTTLRLGVKKAKAKKAVEKSLGVPTTAWKGVEPDPGFRSYGTSLDQDNYWCMGDRAVWWILYGDGWNDPLLVTLDRCLERLTYFGRAESFTRIERTATKAPEPNCVLERERGSVSIGVVPVLAPRPDATRAQIEHITGSLNPAVPPGAQMMYALRPSRPPAKERSRKMLHHRETNLLQFAIGWNVAPRSQVIVRLTSRFRGAVIKELLRIKSGDLKITWDRASIETRNAVVNMTGKDASGNPLKGPHQHTEFLAWCEDGQPTRILVWRDRLLFDEDEQTAIFRAASREFAWVGNGPDAWRVKLIPLDRAVPPPPGFDGTLAKVWESLTPYVPPRHHLRKGKERPRESLEAQIRLELEARGLSKGDDVAVTVSDASWVVAHVPYSQRSSLSNAGNRRGYQVLLRLRTPICGPLRLGHSSSFGLGMFAPVD